MRPAARCAQSEQCIACTKACGLQPQKVRGSRRLLNSCTSTEESRDRANVKTLQCRRQEIELGGQMEGTGVRGRRLSVL